MTHSEEPGSGRPAEDLGCCPPAQGGLVPFFPPPSPDTTTSERPSEEAPARTGLTERKTAPRGEGPSSFLPVASSGGLAPTPTPTPCSPPPALPSRSPGPLSLPGSPDWRGLFGSEWSPSLPFHRTWVTQRDWESLASGGCWPKPGDNQKNSFQKTSSGSYNEPLPSTRHVGPTTNKPRSGGHYRMAHLRCWML